MDKKKIWMYISLGSIVLSIVSTFFPVITYESGSTGEESSYNLIDMIFNDKLIDTVFSEYHGTTTMSRGLLSVIVIIVCLIGVVAIISAFVGIISMEKQYESVWPFRLSMIGLIGTAVPALSLIILWIVSKSDFRGIMSCLGLYIILTPIAMVIACITVTRKHRLNKRQLAIQKEASNYIRPAEDLL